MSQTRFVPLVRGVVVLAVPLGASACGGDASKNFATPEASQPADSGSGGGDGAEPDGGGCGWPEGQAAVSLTYDDAMPTQLSTAVPALAAHDLRATFFITDVRNNRAPWQALLADGHELAAHTFKHPCPAADWVPVGNASEDYDLARMETELDEQVTLLQELGQPQPFTFAYPCGVSWVGADKDSYASLVEERFLAARGVSGSLAGLMPNFFNVPAFFLEGTGEAMIAQVEAAQAAGSWVVFGFHGIGGDWNIAPTESHEALLQYLDDHSDEIYVAPFRDVAQCLLP